MSMKTCFTTVFLGAILGWIVLAQTVHARFLETPQQCNARYGGYVRLEKKGALKDDDGIAGGVADLYTFVKGEYSIRIGFLNGKAAFYEAHFNSDSPIRRPLSSAEIQVLLEANAYDSKWVPTRALPGESLSWVNNYGEASYGNSRLQIYTREWGDKWLHRDANNLDDAKRKMQGF